MGIALAPDLFICNDIARHTTNVETTSLNICQWEYLNFVKTLCIYYVDTYSSLIE